MNTLSFQRRIILSVMALASAQVLIGCGNLGSISGPPSASRSAFEFKDSSQDPMENGGFFNDVGYSCPANFNVLPKPQDIHGDGSDKYIVCTSTSNTTDISLHGHPYSANYSPTSTTQTLPQICVYPVKIVNDSTVNPVWNEYALPLNKCFNPGSAAAMHVSFPGTTYDAVFIFTPANQQDMDNASRCLVNHSYASCPHYSGGKIR
jgi:hypothetical protein